MCVASASLQPHIKKKNPKTQRKGGKLPILFFFTNSFLYKLTKAITVVIETREIIAQNVQTYVLMTP